MHYCFHISHLLHLKPFHAFLDDESFFKVPTQKLPKTYRFVSGSFDDNFVYFQDYKIKDKTAALMIMREEREQSHREEMTEEFKLYILFFISSTVPVLSRKNRSEHSMLLKRPSMTISSTYST